MLSSDFKIEIKAKKVPVNINNEIINYIQDTKRSNNHLSCEIYFQNTVIARGIILDFYKDFEILEDLNTKELSTNILTFTYKNSPYQKYTEYGTLIYKMKYLKNPPIDKEIREEYINNIISVFNGYIGSLKEKTNLNITFIPSESKIPNDIANKLAYINNKPLKNIISKNSPVSSKSMPNLSSQTFDKYSIDLSTSNIDDTFVLIDDVIGTSSSICETMYKLFDFNKKINYFLIPVKDVKR